jgi:hypothetical protein
MRGQSRTGLGWIEMEVATEADHGPCMALHAGYAFNMSKEPAPSGNPRPSMPEFGRKVRPVPPATN